MAENLPIQSSTPQEVPPLEYTERIGSLRWRADRLWDEVVNVFSEISESDRTFLADSIAEFETIYNDHITPTLEKLATSVDGTHFEKLEQLLAEAEQLKNEMIVALTKRAGLNVDFYTTGANTTDSIPLVADQDASAQAASAVAGPDAALSPGNTVDITPLLPDQVTSTVTGPDVAPNPNTNPDQALASTIDQSSVPVADDPTSLLANDRAFYKRWQDGDPTLLNYNDGWWNDLLNIKNDIRVSLQAAGFPADKVQSIFTKEIEPWARKVVEKRRQKSFGRGEWGHLQNEVLEIIKSHLAGHDPDDTVFVAETAIRNQTVEEQLKSLTEQYAVATEKLSPLRDEVVDNTLELIGRALKSAQDLASDGPPDVELKRRKYIKIARTNFAKLRKANYFVDGTADVDIEDLGAALTTEPPQYSADERPYVDLVADSPALTSPEELSHAAPPAIEETAEPTYVDLVKDDPLLQIPGDPALPVSPVDPTVTVPSVDLPSDSKAFNPSAAIEHGEARESWRAASREYRSAATAYETAYDLYLRNKGVGRKLSEKVQALLGKEVVLPPDLLRLQGEYRSAKRQYAESLAAALATRSGVYDGNKQFSLERPEAKVAFGQKFISRPRATLNAIKVAALEDAATRSRLVRIGQFMRAHRTAIRLVGLSVATSVGALTGGALGAGVSAGRWAVGVFGGAAVAAGVSRSMQKEVDRAQRTQSLVEARASHKFSLADIDNLDRAVDAAAFEVEKSRVRQLAYTIGSATLFAGSTAYAASFIPRGVDAVPHVTNNELPSTTNQAELDAVASAVENFSGTPFARVPLMEITDLQSPNGVPLSPVRLTEIALISARADGLPSSISEIALVRGFMLAAAKDFLAERPNITKEQLEIAIFNRLEAKYGTSDWWQAAGVKEMHIGSIDVIERSVSAAASTEDAPFITAGEVVVSSPYGELSVKNINFIGNGKPVEIPEAEVYPFFGAIKTTIEKIVTERPQGLTKLDLERELFMRLSAQYGNTTWWKEVAIDEVDISSFGSLRGGAPVPVSVSESGLGRQFATETGIARTVATDIRAGEVRATAVPTGSAEVIPSAISDLRTPGRSSATELAQGATESGTSDSSRNAGAAALEKIESGSRPALQLADEISLSPQVQEVVIEKLGKLVPNAESVEISLSHTTVTEYGLKEPLTTVKVNVLTKTGAVIEAKAVGFGTIVTENRLSKLVMKAVDDLSSQAAVSRTVAETSPFARPQTGRLAVEVLGDSGARTSTLPIESRVTRPQVSVLPTEGRPAITPPKVETLPPVAKFVAPPPLEYVPSGNYLTSESFLRYMGEHGVTYDALRAQVDRTVASFEGKTYKGFWEEMKYRSPYQELGKMTAGEVETLRQKMWGNEAAVRQYALEHNFKYETLMKWANQIDAMKLEKTLPVNENTPIDDWVQRYIALQMIKERGATALVDTPPSARLAGISPEQSGARPHVRETTLSRELAQQGIAEAAVDRRVSGWVRSIERGNVRLEGGTYASPYSVLGKMAIEDVNRLRRIFEVDPISLREFATRNHLSEAGVRKWFGQIDTLTNNAPIPKVGATFSDWFRHEVASEMMRSGEGRQQVALSWSPRTR